MELLEPLEPDEPLEPEPLDPVLPEPVLPEPELPELPEPELPEPELPELPELPVPPAVELVELFNVPPPQPKRKIDTLMQHSKQRPAFFDMHSPLGLPRKTSMQKFELQQERDPQINRRFVDGLNNSFSGSNCAFVPGCLQRCRISFQRNSFPRKDRKDVVANHGRRGIVVYLQTTFASGFRV